MTEIPPLTEADYMKPLPGRHGTTTIVQRLRDRDVTQLSGNWRERHRRRSSHERSRDREGSSESSSSSRRSSMHSLFSVRHAAARSSRAASLAALADGERGGGDGYATGDSEGADSFDHPPLVRRRSSASFRTSRSRRSEGRRTPCAGDEVCVYMYVCI